MKMSHSRLIVLSGLVWFAVGFYLLQLGINLLLSSINLDTLDNHPLIRTLAVFLGTPQSAALLCVVIALTIGYFKGRYVLGKSAHKGVARILEFPNPAPLSKIYSAKYYILLGLMIALGISIKYMGISNDIRGLIDTAIGAALINGAMIYFKLAQAAKVKAN